MTQVRVALLQFAPILGRLEENLARVLDGATRAAELGARLLVAPEMCLTGWSLADPALRAALADEVASTALPRLTSAAEHTGVGLVVGGPYRGEASARSNCALGVAPDGRIAVHRKVHLFGVERAWWAEGDRAEAVMDVGDVRVGLLIGYDAEFPELPRLIRLAGAALLAVPTTNMTPYERDQDLIFPTRALENECAVAVCNQVGSERGWTYFGRSLVADARGEVVGRAGSGEELLVLDVDVPDGPADPELSYLARRRPEVYARLSEAHVDGPMGHRIGDRVRS